MARDIKTEMIRRETIKPSSPIPNNPKTINLSFWDQLASPSYIPMVLFYPKNNIKNGDQISKQLKKSLSEALTHHFYPFTGRIKANNFIECDDDDGDDDNGAKYMEVRIHSPLSSFLEEPNFQVLKKFLPIEPQSSKEAIMSLLQVQLSFFECGGIAIGLCMSHKVADASTMSTFIRVWAAINASFGDQAQAHEITQQQLPIVNFNASSYFPPRDHLSSLQLPAMMFKGTTKPCVTKRYVFYGPKIEALRAKAMSPLVERPSRVEAVTSLIWRCFMNAWRSLNTKIIYEIHMAVSEKFNISEISKISLLDTEKSNIKYSIMIQLANVRTKVQEPFLGNTMGNLVQHFATVVEESKMELQDLVGQLRKGNVELGEKIGKMLGGDELLEMVDGYRKGRESKNGGGVDDEMKLYFCSSWCKFQLYGVADFGWGKPIWVNNSGTIKNNFFLLTDTRGGDGIEAWVTLNEEEMTFFEKDTELLAFASSNPSVLES